MGDHPGRRVQVRRRPGQVYGTRPDRRPLLYPGVGNRLRRFVLHGRTRPSLIEGEDEDVS